jgi:pimeloyl-ACP methyl ester carboxylesterase
MAKAGGVLLRSPAHRLSADVSFPASWRPGKEFPVLVCVEGEGAYFEGALHHFRDARGPREWIVVCPHTLSSSEDLKFDRYRDYGEALVREWNGRRMEFDEPGVLALLDFLAEHFGASRKVAVAAHSKGALVASRLAAHHAERLRSVAFACPRLDPSAAAGGAPVEGGGPPALFLTAEGDPDRAARDAAVEAARKQLEGLGWSRIERRALPGACSDFPAEVWDFVAPAAVR